MNRILHSRSDVLPHHYESNKLHRSHNLNIFITGPRHFADRNYIMESCNKIVKEIMKEHKAKHGHESFRVKIISGMNSPVCAMAHDFAVQNNYRHEAVSFNSPIGRMGFFARRKALRHSKKATHVISFWDESCDRLKRMTKCALMDGATIFKVRLTPIKH